MKNIRKSDALIIQPSITSYIGSKPKVLTQYLLISAPAGKQNPVTLLYECEYHRNHQISIDDSSITNFLVLFDSYTNNT